MKQSQGKSSGESETALRAVWGSSQRWQSTFKAIADNIFILDSEKKIVQYNEATKNFIKKSSNHILYPDC